MIRPLSASLRFALLLEDGCAMAVGQATCYFLFIGLFFSPEGGILKKENRILCSND
jgi:hypothetical protein